MSWRLRLQLRDDPREDTIAARNGDTRLARDTMAAAAETAGEGPTVGVLAIRKFLPPVASPPPPPPPISATTTATTSPHHHLTTTSNLHDHHLTVARGIVLRARRHCARAGRDRPRGAAPRGAGWPRGPHHARRRVDGHGGELLRLDAPPPSPTRPHAPPRSAPPHCAVPPSNDRPGGGRGHGRVPSAARVRQERQAGVGHVRGHDPPLEHGHLPARRRPGPRRRSGRRGLPQLLRRAGAIWPANSAISRGRGRGR